MLKKNVIELAIDSAEYDWKDAKRNRKSVLKFIEDYADEIGRVISGSEILLEWLIRAEIDASSNCLDLSYSGDKLVLQGIYKVFRKLGYQSETRPQENEPTFTSFWNHPESDMKIWLRFTSTVCKRVKIGTKTVEEDIYETRCG